MVSPADLRAVRKELSDWFYRKPESARNDVRARTGFVLSGLDAAQIGARPHPRVVEQLAKDVAELERAALLSRK